MINLIDSVEDSKFLGSIVNTVQEVFSNVYVFTEGAPPESLGSGRTTFVVAAMNRPLDSVNLSSDCGVPCKIFSLSEQGRAELAQKSGMILTDDFAPVENLLASVVQSHSLARARPGAGSLLDRILGYRTLLEDFIRCSPPSSGESNEH